MNFFAETEGENVTACSWSGGKDCCLALHRGAEMGLDVRILVTMLTEDGKRSRSNGVSTDVLEAQAEALRATLIALPTSWAAYERTFEQALFQAGETGASNVIFGDIDEPSHRRWNERMCRTTQLKPILPLWGAERKGLIREMEEGGYHVRMASVNARLLGTEYLGRQLDSHLAAELSERHIDICGENGEFHTVVLYAPGFSKPISIQFAPPTLQGGYWHSEISLVMNSGA